MTVVNEFKVFKQETRYRIVRALWVSGATTFTRLRQKLHLTDGNLSVHAIRLENAGVVSCTKTFRGRVPCTTYALTPHGRALLETFLAMERQEREW